MSPFHPFHPLDDSHRLHVMVGAHIPPARPFGLHLDDPFYDGTNDPRRTGDHHHSHHDVVAPRFDVEETDDSYFLQGEFPGVTDKDEITLERCGPRTLAVMAHMPKFDIHKELGALSSHDTVGGINLSSKKEEAQAASDPMSPATQASQLERPVHVPGVEPRTTAEDVNLLYRLSERRAGKLQRSFTFPTAVHLEGLKANFGHGLLKIKLPKSKVEDGESHRISIEDW